MLRAAGAVILGKTVTTECATYPPGKTRNPHDPERTPGGSSSGSAAAVAAGMVPLALGTQTNGSVIRPAAYCGVYGFKPTHGLISRHGILKLSRTLDCVGLFARTLDDIALARRAAHRLRRARPRHAPARAHSVRADRGRRAAASAAIRVREDADLGTRRRATREAFAELVDGLGASVRGVRAAGVVAEAWDWHRTIMEAEMAANLDLEWEKGRDKLSDSLREQLARGREITRARLPAGAGRVPRLIERLRRSVRQLRCDPDAGRAAAPRRRSTRTGDPAFCTLWTLCGMPA